MSTATKDKGRRLFKLGKLEYDLSSRTHLVGILNVTPDSFSDGGRHFGFDRAIEHAHRMAEEGADIIDIGGESTRPGSESVSEEEELRRVVPVIKRLAKELEIPLSIDTYKSRVAEQALAAGASIVNDISGFTADSSMLTVVAQGRATAIVMHMKGTPKTMQQNPSYDNVTLEVAQFLERQVAKARSAGIDQVIVDPGIGFGKNLEQNLQLIRELKILRTIGCPVLVGPSRKSFIGTILDLPVEQRLEGTAAVVTACILNGAELVRVHDVKEMKRVASVADALRAHQ
jgi:dihydropteroate synthase